MALEIDDRYAGQMDNIESEMAKTNRELAQDNRTLLVEIEAGRAGRRFTQNDIAALEAEAERFEALAAALEASING